MGWYTKLIKILSIPQIAINAYFAHPDVCQYDKYAAVEESNSELNEFGSVSSNA